MRVFFALWPDDNIRQALVEAQSAVHGLAGGRRMRTETLHLTLVFIGDVACERLPDLLRTAGNVRTAAFEFSLDLLECWRRNRIAHLGASVTPGPLSGLVTRIESGLMALQIPFDQRPYVPHVTLVRNLDCAKGNPAWPPVTWPVRDFVLVRSSLRPEGARYEQLGRWPLL